MKRFTIVQAAKRHLRLALSPNNEKYDRDKNTKASDEQSGNETTKQVARPGMAIKKCVLILRFESMLYHFDLVSLARVPEE